MWIAIQNAIGARQGVGGGPGPGPTPPLDTYTDAAAAFSVRLLRTAYSGSALRVRRAVPPYDEQDIGFTAGGDLDEAAIVAFGGTDSLTVSAWYDQSGQQNHATQITPGAQPQIYDGTAVITENGKPAVEFNGDKLGQFALSVTQPYTFNFVGRYAGNVSVAFAPFFGSGGGIATSFVSFLLRANNFQMQAPSLTNVTSANTNQHNFFMVFDGASSLFGLDGGTATTVNPGTADIENFAIGARGADTGVTELRYFQELVLWDSDQNAAGSRTGIEADAQTYYSIP